MLFRLAEQIGLLEAVNLEEAKALYKSTLDSALYLTNQGTALPQEAIASLLNWTFKWGKELLSHQAVQWYENALHVAEAVNLSEASFKLSCRLAELIGCPSVMSADSSSQASDLFYKQFLYYINALYHAERGKIEVEIQDTQRDIQRLLAKVDYEFAKRLIFLRFDQASTSIQPNLHWQASIRQFILMGEQIAQSGEPSLAKKLYDSVLDITKRVKNLQVDISPLLEATANANDSALNLEAAEKTIVQPANWLNYRKTLADTRAIFFKRLARVTLSEVLELETDWTKLCCGLISQIIKDIETFLGEAPCGYAFLRLGSGSLEKMTLYSDIEPLLLIETRNANTLMYFRAMIKVLQYRLASLGETDPKRPGLHLDAPYLLDEEATFIATPEAFIDSFYPDNLDDQSLCSGSRYAPLNASYLCGNAAGEKLFSRYTSLLTAHLAKQKEGEALTMRQFLGIKQLQYDTAQYAKQCETLPVGKINLKERFAKPLVALCRGFALYHGIEKSSFEEILEALEQTMGLEGEPIRQALACVEYQRLLLQEKFGYQCEEIWFREEDLVVPLAQGSEDLHLVAVEREILQPLYQAITAWLEQDVEEDVKQKANQERWWRTLQTITQNDPPAEGPIIQLEWIELGETNRGQCRYLRGDVARQLVSDGKLKLDKRSYPEANHPVHRLIYGKEDVHLKFYPELPGIEIAVNQLSKRLLLGKGKEVTLAKLQYKDQVEPVLLSSTIHGYNLSDQQACLPRLKQIDPKTFTEAMLFTVVTNPDDAKPDNHILMPHITRSGYYRYALVDVDPDHAFQEALVTNHWGQSKLNVKSIVYCCDAMKKPIEPAAVACLLELDPYQVLKSWLEELTALDGAHWTLFKTPIDKNKSTLIERCLKRNPLEKSTLPILLEGVMVRELYEKLCRIQRHLTVLLEASELPNHFELLGLIEPNLGLRYEPAFEQKQILWQRFDSLTSHAYSTIAQGHHRTILDHPKAKRSGLRVIPRERDVLNRQKYSPTVCLRFLKEALVARRRALDKIRETLEQGDSRLFEQETFPYFRELIVNGIRFAKLSPERQVFILKAISKTSFRILNLHHCEALTDDLLQPILKSSGQQLWELDVSACSQLTEASLANIAYYTPHIERLNLSETEITSISKYEFFNDFGPLKLLRLRTLVTRSCSNLISIYLEAPQLERWVGNDCASLTQEEVKIKSRQIRYADLRGCSVLKEPGQLLTQLLYPYRLLPGHKNMIFTLTTLSDGRLASASNDGTIKLWDTRSGRCLKTLTTKLVRVFAELPDGRLASGCEDWTIKLWDTRDGRCLKILTGHKGGGVYALAVLPDGRLASAGWDWTIKLWDTHTGRCLTTLAEHKSGIDALAVLPDGRLASASWDGTIKLWDTRNGKCLATLTGHSGPGVLVLLPDGRLVSAGCEDGTIKLWDTHNGQRLATLIGHNRRVSALVLLPDGRLASASWDRTIKLWDTRNGNCLATLTEHKERFTALTMLPGGNLASGSWGGMIKLWTVPYPVVKLTPFLAGEPSTLAHLPSNRFYFHSPLSSLQQFKQRVRPLFIADYPFMVFEQKETVEISLLTETLSEEEAIHLLETLQAHITSCFEHWNLTFNMTRRTLIVQGHPSKRNALLNLLQEIGLGKVSLKSDQGADDLREKKREHEY
jgi:WD40 repeat protein